MTAKRMKSKPTLRQCAEKQLPRDSATIGKSLSRAEANRLLHELQVHQIELEMQNEELRRAQAELDVTQARYFDLYDLAPVGYCTLDEKGMVQEANLTAALLLGVAREALVGKPISRFIVKADQDVYYLHRKRLFETAQPQACELRMAKKDGTSFWARLNATVVQAAEGVPMCRIALSDIADLRRTDEALRQRETELKGVLDATDDGILAVDSLGKIISANRQFLELWRIPPEVMATREERRLLEFAVTQLSDPKAFLQAVHLLYGSRQEDLETLQFKDGRIIERRSVPLIKENSLVGRVWSFRDVTERRRAEAILREHHVELEQCMVRQSAVAKVRTRQLHTLDRRLVNAEETERQRIAHVLHEEVQQILVAARAILHVGLRQTKEKIPQASFRRVDGLLLEAMEETRDLVHEIMPAGLREGGLFEVIMRLSRKMREKYDFTVIVTGDKHLEFLDDEVSICVYHAVRELLLNIHKHAEVTCAKVIFDMQDDGWLAMTVQDDGVGFKVVEWTRSAASGSGLNGIREQIEGFGGRMKISSRPGRGTSICLQLPPQEPDGGNPRRARKPSHPLDL